MIAASRMMIQDEFLFTRAAANRSMGLRKTSPS